MRIICMWCNNCYKGTEYSTNSLVLNGVCPQCYKRVKKANKKYLRDKNERDKRFKRR